MPELETVQPPFLPIVYVRGYAGTQAEVEDTTADPYMGFNLGSTKIRQTWTRDISRHVFESPLIRLMKDHGYKDIYDNGAELPLASRPHPRSIWIYRYYEPVSNDLGNGRRPEMENYAGGLHELIERVRDQMCGPEEGADEEAREARSAFRVHIIAHSMGGLVTRCYLQNVWPAAQAKKHGRSRSRYEPVPVDKVFSYATPHGGIDFRLVGNVPGFLQFNNVENFNVERIRQYLKLPAQEPVTSLGNALPADRFFCLVGTNHRDYAAAAGMSRRAVGPMSDGLVQIRNASVDGAPRAFVHRSHSGHYGIVNSEEGYQNLRRFLFGDIRVDAVLTLDDITLPGEVEVARQQGKKVRASYHVETVARVRGSRWDLHRRTTDEESAHFVTYDDYVRGSKQVHLLSAFLMDTARVKAERETLGFSLDLRVLVPEYVVDGFWINDDHYDGGYLFRDKFNLELSLAPDAPPRLLWGVDSQSPNQALQEVPAVPAGAGEYEFRIPVAQNTTPGLRGTLVLRSRPWS